MDRNTPLDFQSSALFPTWGRATSQSTLSPGWAEIRELSGVGGADFCFLGMLESSWPGSERLALRVLPLPCCLPRKRVSTVNQKAIWFIAMVVGRSGFWTDSGCSLSSMKWKKGELINYKHMQEHCWPSQKFFWNMKAPEVARSALGSLRTCPSRRLSLLLS